MTTAQEANKFYSSDITKKLTCETPDGKPIRHEWLETTSANIKPGYAVIRATGAAGEKYCTEAGNDSPLAYGIADLDPNQIANCDVAYASGDIIPVIPFHKNVGAVLRNVYLADPGAAVDVDTPLCCEADGVWGVAVEAALLQEGGAGNSGFDDAVTTNPGVNGATGSTIHNRIFMRSQYYVADPNAASRIVARISPW